MGDLPTLLKILLPSINQFGTWHIDTFLIQPSNMEFNFHYPRYQKHANISQARILTTSASLGSCLVTSYSFSSTRNFKGRNIPKRLSGKLSPLSQCGAFGEKGINIALRIARPMCFSLNLLF